MAAQTVPIKSYVRVRPVAVADAGRPTMKVSADRISVDADGGSQTYVCEKVYGGDVSISNIYMETCESVVNRVLEGSNASFIAVGSTGAGKSYFLQGSDNELGLVSHIFQGLFNGVTGARKDKVFLIAVSFIEVMDEQMVDLLNPHANEMKVVQHPLLGNVVDGLSELVVRSADDVARLYDQGCRARRMNVADIRAHRERSHAVFSIVIEQRDSADAKLRLRSKVTIADLAGIESSACAAFVDVIQCLGSAKRKSAAVPYNDSLVTRCLQDLLGGNTITVMFAIIFPNQTDAGLALGVIQDARNIKNQVQINVNDFDRVISDIRESISKLRDQIAQHSGSKEDVKRLQELVKELQMAKQQTWEEKTKASFRYEQERKANLANRGLLEWVMESRKKGNAEAQQRVAELQKEKDQISLDYKAKRQVVDSLKDDLQKKIEDYAKLSETGKAAESDGRTLVTAIHSLKERLQRESDGLRNTKLQIADIAEKLRKEKEQWQTKDDTRLRGDTDMRRNVESEERSRREAENRALVNEELERSKFEFEQEKADIQLRIAEGKKYSPEECTELETTIAQMKAEKSVVTLQLQVLQQDKEQLIKSLEDAYKQHKTDLEIQQLQNFQAFRDYREIFEKQKAQLEQRYRQLLEDAVQDAVYLSSRNTEFQQENLELKQQIAELKDKITRKGS